MYIYIRVQTPRLFISTYTHLYINDLEFIKTKHIVTISIKSYGMSMRCGTWVCPLVPPSFASIPIIIWNPRPRKLKTCMLKSDDTIFPPIKIKLITLSHSWRPTSLFLIQKPTASLISLSILISWTLCKHQGWIFSLSPRESFIQECMSWHSPCPLLCFLITTENAQRKSATLLSFLSNTLQPRDVKQSAKSSR